MNIEKTKSAGNNTVEKQTEIDNIKIGSKMVE